MHFLRAVANEMEGLTRFVEQVCENSVTQGVIVDLNPIWLAGFRLSQAGLDPNLMFDFFDRGFGFHGFAFHNLLLDLVTEEQPLDASLDIHWTTGAVDEINRIVFRRELSGIPALLVKVIVSPIVNPELVQARAALVETVRGTRFPAIVETRYPAQFVACCGDPCISASGSSGTVGGFLEDRTSGKVYATTCGHVVASGKVSVHGHLIGTCSHVRVPKALASGQLCNSTSASVNRLDFALIDVGAQKVTNTMSTVARQVFPRETISIAGGESGRHPYEVGGVGMVYPVGGVCFGNLFEVRPPAPRGIVSAKLKAALATIPKQGDSGAWVERSSVPDWCGVVVAADHLMGYAMESDSVISEANRQFGMDLGLA